MLYDEELMVKDLANVFKAKLNTEIELINTEKLGIDQNDKRQLEPIPEKAYVFETLGDSMLNYKGFFVMYGLSDTPIMEATTGNLLESIQVTFQVACFDKGEKSREDLLYKLLRYRRALKAVIMKNPDVFRGYAKPLIGSLKPNAFEFNGSVVIHVGVDIKASVTAN